MIIEWVGKDINNLQYPEDVELKKDVNNDIGIGYNQQDVKMYNKT